MNIERAKAIATIVVTAAVNIANLYGFAVDAELAVNGVLTVISLIGIFVCWWFNQNWTKEAQQAQLELNRLKNEKKAKEAA